MGALQADGDFGVSLVAWQRSMQLSRELLYNDGLV